MAFEFLPFYAPVIGLGKLKGFVCVCGGGVVALSSLVSVVLCVYVCVCTCVY